LHFITINDTHTHTHILGRTSWTRDQPVAETSTCTTHNIHKRKHSCPRRDSNPQFQQANGRSPTRIGFDNVIAHYNFSLRLKFCGMLRRKNRKTFQSTFMFRLQHCQWTAGCLALTVDVKRSFDPSVFTSRHNVTHPKQRHSKNLRSQIIFTLLMLLPQIPEELFLKVEIFISYI
jgi:hypothetical protein